MQVVECFLRHGPQGTTALGGGAAGESGYGAQALTLSDVPPDMVTHLTTADPGSPTVNLDSDPRQLETPADELPAHGGGGGAPGAGIADNASAGGSAGASGGSAANVGGARGTSDSAIARGPRIDRLPLAARGLLINRSVLIFLCLYHATNFN